jgi:AMP-binding enzyme
LEEVRPDVPALREVIMFTEWEDFVASGEPSTPLPDVHPDDTAQIQYTSGTTGNPKGAELHHRGLTNNARFYAERIGLAPGEVYVNPMPLFHTAGCGMGVLGSAQSQAAHVPVLAFDPALVLELLESEQSNVFGGVPTMMIAMLEHPDLARRDLSALRCALSGGAPIPAELVRRVEERLGIPFCIVFGTTECSPLLTQTRLDDTATDRAETLGQPLPQTEVQVADAATGQPVPLGQVGARHDSRRRSPKTTSTPLRVIERKRRSSNPPTDRASAGFGITQEREHPLVRGHPRGRPLDLKAARQGCLPRTGQPDHDDSVPTVSCTVERHPHTRPRALRAVVRPDGRECSVARVRPRTRHSERWSAAQRHARGQRHRRSPYRPPADPARAVGS